MKHEPKAVHTFERAFLLIGLSLLAFFALAHVHRFLMFHSEMAQFEASKAHPPTGEAGAEAADPASAGNDSSPAQSVEYSLWSTQRVKAHRAALSKSVEALAILRIPRLHLEVPVLEGTGGFVLNRGVGRIAGTSLPGEDGNLGIAGHRDGFFRSLKDIRTGDVIELVTKSETNVYVVDRILITGPDDVSVLRPRTKRALTLVTCYPFYFVGPAPRRYIVEALLQP